MDIGQILQNNNPLNSFAQGFQIGSVMRQQQALNKQREQEVLKQTQIEERARSLQSDIDLLTKTTDPYERMTGLNNVMLKYPEMADKFKNQATFYGDEVKNNAINQLLPALNALNLGNKDVAVQRLQTASEAFKNSGNTRGANALDAYITDIQSANDVGPLVQTGYMTLAGIIGPDKLMETLSKSQEYAKTQAVMPSEISKVQSEAAIQAEKANQAPLETAIKAEQAKQAPLETQIKSIQAKFEETKQAQELEQRGWNITKLKNDIDISRQNARIAAMNAQLAKENNDVKRQELLLKAQDAQAKRDELLNKKITDVESARINMDNMLKTANRILATPMSVVESATGPISQKLPTLSQDTQDFESLVDSLKSQAFLAQIPNIKGMGALSNAEGEKLQQALQNFDLKQSPKQLLGNIREAQRLVMKARKNVADQYGVPENTPDMAVKSGTVTRIK